MKSVAIMNFLALIFSSIVAVAEGNLSNLSIPALPTDPIASSETDKDLKLNSPEPISSTSQQGKDNMTNSAVTGQNPKVLMKISYSDGSDSSKAVVEIELYRNKAPNHVQRFLDLAKEGFYNGLTFHRVIDGFMVQSGDPKGDGTGGSSKPNLKAEFNDLEHKRGVISMARSSDPNSANSQFFIMLGDAGYLDGQYSAFGAVKSGMEYIDKIKKGDAKQNGTVINPDKIESISIVQE